MAAVSRLPILIPSFECRSDPEFCLSDSPPNARRTRSAKLRLVGGYAGCLSTPIFKFPPNFVRQLSNKARRNCSNIGVAQVVAASWSNGFVASRSSSLVRTMASGSAPVEVSVGVTENEIPTVEDLHLDGKNAEGESVNHYKHASILKSDSSIAIHAGERWDRAIITDAITTPIVNTSAYFFKKTADLIDFKEKRRESYEYGRYGNYTTTAAAAKISALEGAESTLLLASGMSATTVLLMALVPAGGHLITTTDCYRRTRIFIETFLPKMGISATVIDPADVVGLESALEKSNTALFFTESPTNPFLRCVDIERVSKLCHKKGTLVCIDATFATPINQKSLTLGADIVVHSATKYIAGHNAIIAGAISGPEELIAPIRNLHHVMGGVLNPHAAFLLIEGMKTVSLRVQHQNSTAQRMAELLETHPKIRRVYYPGLKSHPEHELAKKQMTGFGGVVSFEVDGDLLTTAKFVDALKIAYIAPSLGGCESIVDQPAIMSYWDLPQSERVKYGIHDNLVRFSFGLEGFDDLKNDILQALEGI